MNSDFISQIASCIVLLLFFVDGCMVIYVVEKYVCDSIVLLRLIIWWCNALLLACITEYLLSWCSFIYVFGFVLAFIAVLLLMIDCKEWI